MYSHKDNSPETPENEPLIPQQNVNNSTTTSELPPVVKTGSIVALIAVVMMAVVGSLMVSPDPATTTGSQSEEETVATEEATMEVVTTPAASVVEETAETTTTETTETPDAIASEPQTPETTEDLTTATPETTPETTEVSESPETEAALTPDPTPTAEMTTGNEVAAVPETVNIEELNNIIYDKIDRAWTVKGTPVPTSVSYMVTVTPTGAIAEFEPKSSEASENVDNTPLPTLVESDAMAAETAGKTVVFEVVFTDRGVLEVRPSQQ